MIDIIKLQSIANPPSSEKSISEATFYGRNANLVKVEKIFDEMIEIAKAPGGTTSQKFTDKMNQAAVLLRDTFGFTDLQINSSIWLFFPKLGPNLLGTTGCTISHGAIYKMVRSASKTLKTEVVDFDKKSKVVRFAPGNSWSMRLFIGPALFIPNNEYSYTGAEILAIVLHEIGHNFYIGPVRELTSEALSMLTAKDIVDYLQGMIISSMVIEGMHTLDTLENDKVRQIVGQLYSAGSTIAGPAMCIASLLALSLRLFEVGLKITLAPVEIIRGILKYDAEKYSDAFATSYGYGAELSSALSKMNHLRFDYGIGTYTSDISDFFYWIVRFPLTCLYFFTDVHPNADGRLLNDIKYMKAAGEKITDKKQRAEFDREMNKMLALRDEMKNYRGTNVFRTTSAFRAFIQDLLDISDWKDLTTNLYPKLNNYKNLDFNT